MSEVAVLTRTPAAASGIGSILIIDDEAAIRESLETLLEFEGYNVSVAQTGEEGLARMAETPFDLVLLDFALPDRDGLEVLAEIRSLTIERNTLNADREGQIKAIDDRFAPEFLELENAISSRTEHLRSWAEANPDEFGKLKSLTMTHGVIGWRTGTPCTESASRRGVTKALAPS